MTQKPSFWQKKVRWKVWFALSGKILASPNSTANWD